MFIDGLKQIKGVLPIKQNPAEESHAPYLLAHVPPLLI